jgi:gluconolactonase
VLAASFEGTRLTGPNDVVVKSDRSLWFSYNGAGIRGNYLGEKAEQELPFRVYRLDQVNGVLSIAIGDMERPNGLCFSPDETRLYAVDTPGGANTTHVYDIVDGKAVTSRSPTRHPPPCPWGAGCWFCRRWSSSTEPER